MVAASVAASPRGRSRHALPTGRARGRRRFPAGCHRGALPGNRRQVPGQDSAPARDTPAHDGPGHDGPGHDRPRPGRPRHQTRRHRRPRHHRPGHDTPGHKTPTRRNSPAPSTRRRGPAGHYLGRSWSAFAAAIPGRRSRPTGQAVRVGQPTPATDPDRRQETSNRPASTGGRRPHAGPDSASQATWGPATPGPAPGHARRPRERRSARRPVWSGRGRDARAREAWSVMRSPPETHHSRSPSYSVTVRVGRRRSAEASPRRRAAEWLPIGMCDENHTAVVRSRLWS